MRASLENQEKDLVYRHRGVYYQTDARQLKGFFGMATKASHEMDKHSNTEARQTMAKSVKQFLTGRSQSAKIRDPKFFYLQHLISYTILAWDNGTQKLTVADMEVMR